MPDQYVALFEPVVGVIEDGAAFETAHLAGWCTIFSQHVINQAGVQATTGRWNNEYKRRLDRLTWHRSPLTK